MDRVDKHEGRLKGQLGSKSPGGDLTRFGAARLSRADHRALQVSYRFRQSQRASEHIREEKRVQHSCR